MLSSPCIFPPSLTLEFLFFTLLPPLCPFPFFAVDNCEGQGVAGLACSARHRFAGMPSPPGDDGAFYFSYETGPLHIISVSSFYYGGFAASSKMTQWLQSDLASFDRSKTPWLIVMLHAPWYNSNTAHQGDGEAMRQAYEQIFISAGVNIVVTGHVHSAEFSYFVNNNQIDTKKGIMHFNLGDAGADLYTSWMNPQPTWSAFRSAAWGHGELEFVNASFAHFTWHRNSDSEPTIGWETWVPNLHI
jgi:hypothetical protein